MLALVLLQLERFLAVRHPFHSEQLTVRHTVGSMGASLLLAMGIIGVVVLLDRDFKICQDRLVGINVHINPVSIFLVSYPRLLAIILTLAVSGVLKYEILKLNSVHPHQQIHLHPL